MTTTLLSLEKICAPEDVKAYKEEQKRKYGDVWEDIEKWDKKSREHSTSHAFHTNTSAPPHHDSSFADELTRFTQGLLALVYPPTPAPPWSGSSAHATPLPARSQPTSQLPKSQQYTRSQPASRLSTQPQTTQTTGRTRQSPPTPQPSPQLAALCARLAHVTAVAARYPDLAALRFSVEFKQGPALFGSALAPPHTIAGARPAQQPHANAAAILHHANDKAFKRLHSLAGAYDQPSMYHQHHHWQKSQMHPANHHCLLQLPH
jgi:hypothetical protein